MVALIRSLLVSRANGLEGYRERRSRPPARASRGGYGSPVAGYSGTPLPKKLGIKPGSRVALVGGPDGFEAELEPLPDGVTVRRQARAPLDVICFFTTERREVERRFLELGRRLEPDGSLWICWPKRASKVPTDITENVLRDVILPSGLVDTKVCAVDDVWSGLRFVWRKELRPAASRG
jgi:hypothetical protein